MKKPLLLAAALACGVLTSSAALAHHHHHGARLSIGLNFGAPLYWHPWYYPAYYPVYVAPAVVQPAPAPVYIERHESPTTDINGWWYYCENARGYYPYVKECPGGWKKVPPAPQQ